MHPREISRAYIAEATDMQFRPVGLRPGVPGASLDLAALRDFDPTVKLDPKPPSLARELAGYAALFVFFTAAVLAIISIIDAVAKSRGY